MFGMNRYTGGIIGAKHAALALENGVANLRIVSSQSLAFTSGGSRDGKLKALPFRLGRIWYVNKTCVL